MIGLIKRSLMRAGTTKVLMEIQDFITTLAECTSVVNCKPLTYVSSEDDIAPLRPIDFVYPANRLRGILDVSMPPDTDFQTWERKQLMENWSRSSTITEDFQRRWNREYVQVLQERHQFGHNQNKTSPHQPTNGDVVLIEHPTLGRAHWPLGRIVEVKPRSVLVTNGSTKRIVEYPFKSVYPLETELKDNTATPAEQTTPITTLATPIRRSTSPINKDSKVNNSIGYCTRSYNDDFDYRSPNRWIFLDFYNACIFNNIEINYGFAAHQFPSMDIIGTLYVIHTCIISIQVVYALSRGLLFLVKGFLDILKCLLWKSICTKRRKDLTKTSTIALLFTIMVFFGATHGCSEIASIQATDDVCIQSEDKESCQLKTTSILNIRPNGSTACFRIRDDYHQLESFVETLRKCPIDRMV
ncbi:unnamed protein product [Caenorhabditis nigoni]